MLATSRLGCCALALVVAASAPALGQQDQGSDAGTGLPPAAPVRAGGGVFPDGVPETLGAERVLEPIERAAGYLLERQKPSGTWGSRAPESTLELGFALETYYSWQLATQGLCCMALASMEETPELRAALDSAIDYLCTTRLSKRKSDWDIDYVWSAVYGFGACVDLLGDPRYSRGERAEALTKRGKEFLALLEANQALSGGWAYYDDPPFDRVPTWATSFTTAAVVPYLVKAQDERGWLLPPRMLDRAVKYLRRCALPNGAYSYSLSPTPRITGVESIDLMEGSLGRTQACNWALAQAGDKHITADVLREGLEALFSKHGFLDHVRTRPIPHEGYHANAGYFYFFAHYYAAHAIELLPEAEREEWHARLRPHLVKTQWRNGGMSDFLDTAYLVNASTSFTILALNMGLAEPDETPAEEEAQAETGKGEDQR